MSRVNVAIALAGEARERLYEVADICRALGFGHTSTRSDSCVLVGSAEIEDLAVLRAVPGVLSVELDERRPARGARRSPAIRIRRAGVPRGRHAAGSMRER